MKALPKHGGDSGTERNEAGSVARSLLILECFTPDRHRLSLSDIQKRTGMPKSSVFRFLRALAGLNYLKYDHETKRYYLGPRVLSLGFSVLASLDVRQIARPYMQSLCRELKTTVNLLMLDDLDMVFIERSRFPVPWDFNVDIGSRMKNYQVGDRQGGARAPAAGAAAEVLRPDEEQRRVRPLSRAPCAISASPTAHQGQQLAPSSRAHPSALRRLQRQRGGHRQAEYTATPTGRTTRRYGSSFGSTTFLSTFWSAMPCCPSGRRRRA